MEFKNCPYCNEQIAYDAIKCRHCGEWLQDSGSMAAPKKFIDVILLSYFLGYLGVHRFYTGYIGIGVAQLLTVGGCGLWSFIDFVAICFNAYKDSEGRPLYKYDKMIGVLFFIVPLIFLLIIISIFALYRDW